MSSSRAFSAFCCLRSVKKQKHITSMLFFVQCMTKQLLDSVFVISRIIKVLVKVIGKRIISDCLTDRRLVDCLIYLSMDRYLTAGLREFEFQFFGVMSLTCSQSIFSSCYFVAIWEGMFLT